MTGKRFLTLLAHHGIPASCLAQRLGCNITSITKLSSYDTVPKHYVNKLLSEFGACFSSKDLQQLKELESKNQMASKKNEASVSLYLH